MRRHGLSILVLTIAPVVGGCTGQPQISQPTVEGLPVAVADAALELRDVVAEMAASG